MAKDTISQYSTTAGSNTDIQSVSIAEGMAPSDVNNAIRELMVDLASLCDGTQHLNALDINGGELVLDADGDTSITADTDDTIDIKVAGADDFQITANTMSVLSGSTLNIDSGATIANSGTATGFGGDLSFGGDTFGANKVIGSNDTYSLSLETDGNTAMTISTAGEITKPLQPCVLVNPNATQTNFAVNTDVTIVWGTEVFDIGGNFASNTFTAPVTGKYLVSYSVRLENLDSASAYYYIGLFASNRQYYPILSSDRFSADVPYWSCTGSITIDMDASDTFYMIARQNNGTAQSDIAPNASSYLSIVLVA